MSGRSARDDTRTIRDCTAAHVAPDLVAQAVRDRLARGLFTRDAM